MTEIIETLNTCSGPRTFFYCIVFLCALGTIVTGTVGIIRAFTKGSKCKCNCNK